MRKSGGKASTSSDLLTDLAQTRKRLDIALDNGAREMLIMHARCKALSETLTAIRTRRVGPSAADSAKQRVGLLTAREVEVLRHIAEGLSTKEIASRMGISFKTAVSHRTNILQKLNLHETASLVRLAVRAGLVSP